MAGLATGLHLWLPNLVTERMRETVKNKRQAGFSTLELLIVIAMSAIITAIAVPEYVKTAAYLRAAGDLREINGLTALAKMRAAADFTHARVFADLNGGTFQLEVWNKTGNGGAGCWFADLDPTSACLTYSSGRPSGPVNTLAQGDTFGFGTLATGPTPGQPAPAQAAACLDNSNASLGAGTACIVFNSRGIPVDKNNSPLATGAYYLTNGTVVNGVTVSATGSIQAWTSPAGTANWSGQ
jgi:type II secretory pathway pseudopilin PulG